MIWTIPSIFLLVKRGNYCLISPKDVIILRIPYPNTTSGLAEKPHMYICINALNLTCKFVKCQSFKPYHMMPNSLPINRIIEQPNSNENPFRHPTVIDLDKVFTSTQLSFPDSLKTARGISDTLFLRIQACISQDIKSVALSHDELRTLNPMIH